MAPLNSGIVIPKISLSSLDNTQLDSQEYFLGFDLDNFGKLAKLDQAGLVTLIEGGSLESLSDVSFTSPGPQVRDTLVYNGSNWEASPQFEIGYYEYVAVWDALSGTLVKEVNNTLGEGGYSISFSKVSTGIYDFTLVGSGNIESTTYVFAQDENSGVPTPLVGAFTQYTGVDTKARVVATDNVGSAYDFKGNFTVRIVAHY